jgi:hypothetical protein
MAIFVGNNAASDIEKALYKFFVVGKLCKILSRSGTGTKTFPKSDPESQQNLYGSTTLLSEMKLGL